MARIRKQISIQNLIKYDVLVEDTAELSDYFKVSQLPDIFSAGKNSFLIGASPYLKPRSKILVEIVNVFGETIYNIPISTNNEGTSRIISVEIYENTRPGPYKLVLLGQASILKDGTAVPSNLQNTYNVRWTKDIKVEPKLENTSPIRFISDPIIASVEEQLIKTPTASLSQVTQSIDVRLLPRRESGVLRGYTIIPSGSFKFNRKQVGSSITANITYTGTDILAPTQSIFTLPINEIINETTAISDGIPIRINGTTIESIDLYNSTPYTSSNFNIATSSINIQYNDVQIVEGSAASSSFAKIRIANIELHSGQVSSLQISNKPESISSEFVLISNPKVNVSEILTTQSSIGDQPIGNFYSESISRTLSNWYANTLTSSSSPTYPISASTSYFTSSLNTGSHLSLVNSSDRILDAIYPILQTTGSQLNSYAYFIGTKNNYTLFETSEYTLFFNAFYTKQSGSTTLQYSSGTLDVYLVPSQNSKIVSEDPLGQKIASLVSTSDQQNYLYQQFNFEPATFVSASVGLRFVATGGYWHIANVSLKPSVEFGFNPDEVTVLVPNDLRVEELVTYKAKYLDLNNNSTPIETVAIPTYFIGGGGGGATSLDGLSDVILGTLTDGEVLTYISSSAHWQNKPIFPYTGSAEIVGAITASSYKVNNAKETATIAPSGATGTINYDVKTQPVLYYVSNSSNNWTINFRGDSSSTLNSIMNVGESLTAVFMATNGSPAYYANAHQIDGSPVTPKWQGASAPSSGNTNSIDVYSYSIIKTANATFTVLASRTQFA